MAELELVIGEFGMNVDFPTIDDATNNPLDLTSVTATKLNISTTAFVFSKSLTLTTLGDPLDGVSRWAVLSGDVPTPAGVYYGQLTFTTGGTILRKSVRLDIRVARTLPTS